MEVLARRRQLIADEADRCCWLLGISGHSLELVLDVEDYTKELLHPGFHKGEEEEVACRCGVRPVISPVFGACKSLTGHRHDRVLGFSGVVAARLAGDYRCSFECCLLYIYIYITTLHFLLPSRITQATLDEV